MLTVDLKFSITPQVIDLDLEKVDVVTEQITEYENDHSKLINRDLPDQHPMEAITGLNDSIENIDGSVKTLHSSVSGLNTSVDEVEKTVVLLNETVAKVPSESISNAEIAEIWNNVMGTTPTI